MASNRNRNLKMQNDGKLTLTVLSILLINALAAPTADLIDSLPGQPRVSFKQYAGYVTVDEHSDRALFYYFVEAQRDSDSKPLVIWLNGGPGCSSVGLGGFVENGPFHPKGGKLLENNCSWNKEANVLYVETPAGVGFSYSSDTSYYMGLNDTQTANDNLMFLHGWFAKFPEYRARELYLTGESYAGHYIPQFADLIVRSNSKEKIFNLKGVAIGNPLLDFFVDFNSRAGFLWSHGLISDSAYKILTSSCNYARYADEVYRGSGISKICYQVQKIVNSEISKYIDRHDVTLDICLSSLLMQQSKSLRPKMSLQTSTEPDVCVQEESTVYLNSPGVQEAFHARLAGGVRRWQPCSDVLRYDHLNLEIPTAPLFGVLVKAGVRVLVYSGDQDSTIPLTGTRTLVKKLAFGLKLNSTVPYRVWFAEKQVAGWTQVYGDVLSFATVRGAGHEVPFSQPARALVLFKAFVEDRPLPSSV